MHIPPDATPDRRFTWLRGAEFWATLSDSALRTVAAAMQPAAYAAGESIIRAGEPGRHLHVLTRGDAEVSVHAPGGLVSVATMTAGDCFGEMSLLTGDLTSADVIARTDCESLTLDRPAFDALVAGEPQLLREFVRMVSRRLRESNAAIGAARRKEQDLTRFLQDAGAREAELVGKSPAVRSLQRRIAVLAATNAPVLIQGEPGTGKELIARLIHFHGARRDGPLLCADCRQIAETPWGDKLFGDYRAADGQRPPPAVSYLDLASGGTIVLKNIDALPRAIQERLAAFIGPGRPDVTDVRVLATCRQPLADTPGATGMCPALLEVLAAETLVAPPLRERKRDVADLAAHFARRHAQRLGRPAPALDGQALSKLVTYDYRHGNLRELDEAMHRAVILADEGRIDADVIFLGQPPPPSRWTFNLLALPKPAVQAALRVFPRVLQVVVAATFVFILYGAWLAPDAAAGAWSTVLVWSVWWPALVLSFAFAGRSWCSVCPMSSFASAAQRLVSRKWRTPSWLKRHDAAIFMAGFFLIVWAEEASGMRHSPRATGVLLGAILLGAVVTAVLLPRRAWCRYLCPLGGFAGVCSMSGLLELRPTADICAAKCHDHSCFKGDAAARGCPMFNHVMFVDNNRHCVLCLDCVRACPNGSPQLNLRLPALELLTMREDHATVGRFTALLAGLLAAITLLHGWRADAASTAAPWLRDHRVLVVTAMLAVAAAASQLVPWWLARRAAGSRGSAGETRVWQTVTAWLPAVAAGYVAYELNFVRALSELRISLAHATLSSRGTPALSFSALSLVQASVVATGLIVSLVVLWRVSVTPQSSQRT